MKFFILITIWIIIRIIVIILKVNKYYEMLKCIRRPSQLFLNWVFFFQLCFLQCCRIFVTVKCVVTIIQTFIQVLIYLPSLLPPARILFHICNVLRWNVSLKINLSKAPGEVVGFWTPETCSVFGVVGLDVGIIFNLFSVQFRNPEWGISSFFHAKINGRLFIVRTGDELWSWTPTSTFNMLFERLGSLRIFGRKSISFRIFIISKNSVQFAGTVIWICHCSTQLLKQPQKPNFKFEPSYFKTKCSNTRFVSQCYFSFRV